MLFSVFVSPQMAATPFGGLGAPNMDQMAAMGIPGANLNPQVRIGTRDICQRQHVIIKLTLELCSIARPCRRTSWSSCSPWTQSKNTRTLPVPSPTKVQVTFSRKISWLFHSQVESVGCRTEPESWNESRRLQQGDWRSHEKSPRGSVAHLCGNWTRKWVLSMWFWMILTYFCPRIFLFYHRPVQLCFSAGKKDDKRKHSRSRSHSRRRRSGSRSRHRWGPLHCPAC